MAPFSRQRALPRHVTARARGAVSARKHSALPRGAAPCAHAQCGGHAARSGSAAIAARLLSAFRAGSVRGDGCAGSGRGRFLSAERSSAPVVAAEGGGSGVLRDWDGRLPQGRSGGLTRPRVALGRILPHGCAFGPTRRLGWPWLFCGTRGRIYLGGRYLIPKCGGGGVVN